jgi:ABC-type antimicrobial peptide transport system permease subunit
MPFGPIIHFAPTPVILIIALIMGIVVTILIAYLPVRRAARLDPAQALKTI